MKISNTFCPFLGRLAQDSLEMKDIPGSRCDIGGWVSLPSFLKQKDS